MVLYKSITLSDLRIENNKLVIHANLIEEDDSNSRNTYTLTIPNEVLSYCSKKYHEKAIAIKKANAALDDLDE